MSGRRICSPVSSFKPRKSVHSCMPGHSPVSRNPSSTNSVYTTSTSASYALAYATSPALSSPTSCSSGGRPYISLARAFHFRSSACSLRCSILLPSLSLYCLRGLRRRHFTLLRLGNYGHRHEVGLLFAEVAVPHIEVFNAQPVVHDCCHVRRLTLQIRRSAHDGRT